MMSALADRHKRDIASAIAHMDGEFTAQTVFEYIWEHRSNRMVPNRKTISGMFRLAPNLVCVRENNGGRLSVWRVVP